MKLSGGSHRSIRLWAALAASILAHSHSFANSMTMIAGGWVPEKRSLTVTPIGGAGLSGSGADAEVAIIEIDNNLPEYELAIDFPETPDAYGAISEVTLEGLDGTLGNGLQAPVSTRLERGAASGRFLWRPGRQGTATVKYRVKVRVTYERPALAAAAAPADPSGFQRLLVSMPFAY